LKDLNLQDKTEIRLQVYLARCGVASRRSSEQIILDGRVTVNGEIITSLGTKVSLDDVVLLDGQQIHLQETKRYIVLNKPLGYVCSSSDEKGRDVAIDILKPHFAERLYNVGRLDMFSSGLILFTNDGDFAASISHPSAQIEKEYVVEGSSFIPDVLLEKFQKGIRIEGVFYKCKKAERLTSHKIRVILVEGKNREIRNVFQHFDLGIKMLIRVRIGCIELDGLPSGEFRELQPHEVKKLLSLCVNKQY